MEGYTAFISYVLIPTGYTGGSYSQGIHCNYIKSFVINLQNPYVSEININFPDVDDFKFLTSDLTAGTGYTAHEIHALVQLVNNSSYSSSADVKPDSTAWKRYNMTNQLTGHTTGTPLTGALLTGIVFKVPLLTYNSFPSYDLDYLNFPSKETTDDDSLCLGDETYFLGNVTADIKANVYTTDISINLSLNEFNSSNNLTWTSSDKVYITEVGIYNVNKELVAIGKLNNPILKDSTISRTIVFAIDF